MINVFIRIRVFSIIVIIMHEVKGNACHILVGLVCMCEVIGIHI